LQLVNYIHAEVRGDGDGLVQRYVRCCCVTCYSQSPGFGRECSRLAQAIAELSKYRQAHFQRGKRLVGTSLVE
jgi:hypothetical protein